MKSTKILSKILFALLIIFLLSIIAISIYQYLLSKQTVLLPPNSTSDLQTYINNKYGFEFEYPSALTIDDRNDINGTISSGSDYQLKYQVVNDSSPTITEYLIKADAVSQTAYEGYPSIKILETKKTVINGLNCIQRKEELLAAGFTQIKTYFKKGQNIVSLAIIPGPGIDITPTQTDTYSQILSTFKFTYQTSTVPSTSKYTCPASGWVDCMPGTSPKPQCSAGALAWYKANCPDFQGAAL